LKDEPQKNDNDEPVFEVSVKNINTNKQLFNITLSEEELNQHFPVEERSKFITTDE